MKNIFFRVPLFGLFVHLFCTNNVYANKFEMLCKVPDQVNMPSRIYVNGKWQTLPGKVISSNKWMYVCDNRDNNQVVVKIFSGIDVPLDKGQWVEIGNSGPAIKRDSSGNLIEAKGGTLEYPWHMQKVGGFLEHEDGTYKISRYIDNLVAAQRIKETYQCNPWQPL